MKKTNKTIKRLQKEAKQEFQQELKKVIKPTEVKEHPDKEFNNEYKKEVTKVFSAAKEKKQTLKQVVMEEMAAMLKRQSMRHGDLVNAILHKHPEMNRNSIHGAIWYICKNQFKDIIKVYNKEYTFVPTGKNNT